LKISYLLLVLLALLSGCARFWCSLGLDDRFRQRRTPIAVSSSEEIVPFGDDDFLVAHRQAGAPLVTQLTRIRAGHEDLIASAPPFSPSDSAPYIVPRAEHWWFSKQGDEGYSSSVFFVSSNGDRIEQKRVKLIRRYPQVWLPIPGEEPRGIEISVAPEQPSLHIDEITPSGAKPLASFAWWQTSDYIQNDGPTLWSAQALDRGRVAVVAIDGPPRAMTLRLRIVGGEEATESVLPCSVPLDQLLVTALGAAGRLAIVALSKEREVVAIIADVDQPQSARCRVISAAGERAAQPGFGTPAVVWAGEGFVASWIRDDGTVRACELGNLRVPPFVIDVGEGADVTFPLRQLLFADGEYVTFVWRERGGELVLRRMPNNLTGYAVATEFWHLLCGAFEKTGGKPSDTADQSTK
jgi:hypothetical protein